MQWYNGDFCLLGFLVEFFSVPVISGFTTAAALSIASSQLKSLLGISGSANQFLDAWKAFFKNIKETSLWDSVLGFVSVIVLFGFRVSCSTINNTP